MIYNINFILHYVSSDKLTLAIFVNEGDFIILVENIALLTKNIQTMWLMWDKEDYTSNVWYIICNTNLCIYLSFFCALKTERHILVGVGEQK